MSDPILPHDHGQMLELNADLIPSADNFQIVANVFKQLSDGSRLRIFWLFMPLRRMRDQYLLPWST